MKVDLLSLRRAQSLPAMRAQVGSCGRSDCQRRRLSVGDVQHI